MRFYLAYSIYLIWRPVPGNLLMVATDMCRENPFTGESIFGITWKDTLLTIVYF